MSTALSVSAWLWLSRPEVEVVVQMASSSEEDDELDETEQLRHTEQKMHESSMVL